MRDINGLLRNAEHRGYMRGLADQETRSEILIGFGLAAFSGAVIGFSIAAFIV